MKKYVSFRIAKVSNNKIKNQLNHNIRKGWQPSYIDLNKSYKNYTLMGVKDLDIDNIKREQNKRSKRKIQKNTDRFFSGIMTFSSTMKNDYNRIDFDKCSRDFLEKLEKKLNVKVLQAEVHLDEANPHLHLIFDNISENGKAIKRTINPETLSECQTLMSECFKPMGYVRGELNSIRKHLNVKQLHELNEIKETLLNDAKEYKNELNIFNKILENQELTKEEKEILKSLAPSMFKFIEDSTIDKRKQLSNNIDKALSRRTNDITR
jgi:hypothetical protein